jgi:NADPH:quinone reductase-like Zn-dependent oxidoreductase
MKAALLREYDVDPQFGEFREPGLENGGVVAEVAVAGVNPIDVSIATGEVPGRKPPLPSVPGLEGIARVAGRRVYFDEPLAPFGSMGEWALVDPGSLIEVPDGIDDALAVSFGAKLRELGVEVDEVRAVDHEIRPGVSSDEGDGDEWPTVRERILDSEILVFASPT